MLSFPHTQQVKAWFAPSVDVIMQHDLTQTTRRPLYRANAATPTARIVLTDPTLVAEAKGTVAGYVLGLKVVLVAVLLALPGTKVVGRLVVIGTVPDKKVVTGGV